MHRLIDVHVEIVNESNGKYTCTGTIAYEENDSLYEITAVLGNVLRTTSGLASAQAEELVLKWIENMQALEKTEGSHKRLIKLAD